VEISRRCCLVALVQAAAAGIALRAHHSLSGVYDSSNRLTLDATVVEFRFVNPHPLLIVTARPDGERSGEWRLEMDNRFELEAIGMTARTFARGDRIVVSGSRGHGNATALYIRRLDRPADGLWYEQVGSSPRMGGK
jgi:hypothetical protein